MPSLEAYHKSLSYSYAPGIFPATECMLHRREQCRRLLVHSKGRESEGVQALEARCQAEGIRVEEADRALGRISGKENCFAAMVFEKWEGPLDQDEPHIVLHQVADGGNAGTISRTALGFGYRNIAAIRPCTDVFDPHVIRASMGAVFSQSIMVFDTMEEYRALYPGHHLYPFMLDGAKALREAAPGQESAYSLIFGNEGRGLPSGFAKLGTPVRIPHSDAIDSLNVAVAAAIAMYAFSTERR